MNPLIVHFAVISLLLPQASALAPQIVVAPAALPLAALASGHPGETATTAATVPAPLAAREFSDAVTAATARGGRIAGVQLVWGDDGDESVSVRVVVAHARMRWAYELGFSAWGSEVASFDRMPAIADDGLLVSIDSAALLAALRLAAPSSFYEECGESYLVVGDRFVSLDEPSQAFRAEPRLEGAHGEDETRGEGTLEHEDYGCGC